MMPLRKTVLAGVVLLAALACVLVAVSERHIRSPSALLEKGQKLYSPYYPYNGYYDYGYGSYPYGYGGYGYGGYPYYPYDYGRSDDDSYNQWLSYATQQQYADQVAQQQAADYAQQQQYVQQVNAYNQWAATQYKAPDNKAGSELKVAKTPQLVYLGDLEFGGYRHDITGGNDGGYNAPFDINGDGQYVDNWAKVSTQWKHKKGSQQLKEKKQDAKQQQQAQLKHQSNTKQTQLAAKKNTMQKLGAPADFVWQRGYKYMGKDFQPGTDQVWHQGYDNHPGPTDTSNVWKWYNGPQGARGGAEGVGAGAKLQQRRLSVLAREEPSDMVWQNGYSDHPGPIPNEQAPMRPWYWYTGYQKFGNIY